MAKPATNDLIKELIKQVSVQASFVELDKEDNLFDTHILDSYSTIQLIVKTEEALEISFNFEDLNIANFKTISSITELLRNKYQCV
jgi:acyl carrier protein